MNSSMYSVQVVIGEGGFGRVLSVSIGNKGFAVKEIDKTHLMKHKSGVDMLFSELEALKRLDHPFVVTLHAAFNDRKNCYLVMDLRCGGDLRYYLRNRKIFEEVDVAFYIACMSSALDHIHSRNIIHRDIKPENIILDQRGYPHLADFGVAHVHPNDGSEYLTSYLASGTKPYLAPEVFCKAHVHGPESDFWSLGVVAYELLYNCRPFTKHCNVEFIIYLEGCYSLRKEQRKEAWLQHALHQINDNTAVDTCSTGSQHSITHVDFPASGEDHQSHLVQSQHGHGYGTRSAIGTSITESNIHIPPCVQGDSGGMLYGDVIESFCSSVGYTADNISPPVRAEADQQPVGTTGEADSITDSLPKSGINCRKKLSSTSHLRRHHLQKHEESELDELFPSEPISPLAFDDHWLVLEGHLPKELRVEVPHYNILQERLSNDCIRFVRALLDIRPSHRLSSRDIGMIKSHPWLVKHGVHDWRDLHSKTFRANYEPGRSFMVDSFGDTFHQSAVLQSLPLSFAAPSHVDEPEEAPCHDEFDGFQYLAPAYKDLFSQP